MVRYTDSTLLGRGRFDVEGVSHVLSGGGPIAGLPPPERAGAALIHRNPAALPRARLMGRPVYADGEEGAARAVAALGPAIRDRVVVEDPSRPLPEGAGVFGSARIDGEAPERVEVATEAAMASYLVLADTFDPGWSATVDGLPAPIRPAFVAFRAVYLPPGRHRVVFRYRPAGFTTGLAASAVGLAAAAILLARPRRVAPPASLHGRSPWPASWPWWGLVAFALVVAGSVVRIGPGGRSACNGGGPAACTDSRGGAVSRPRGGPRARPGASAGPSSARGGDSGATCSGAGGPASSPARGPAPPSACGR